MYQLHKYISDQENNSYIKKISFLCGVRPDNPCAMYRVFNIVEGLLSKGINCNVFYRTIDITNKEYIKDILESDIVVVYRERYKDNVQVLIDLCNDENIPLVYDCDDLIFEPKYIGYDPMYNSCLEGKYIAYGKDWKEQIDNYFLGIEQFKQAKNYCEYFSSPNEILNQQSGNKSFVISNTINTYELNLSNLLIKNKKKRNNITLGYFSGSNSHNEDFKEIEKQLFNIIDVKYGTNFICIGPVEINRKFKGYAYPKFAQYKETVSHSEMLELISYVDITIAPLKDNLFNKCKSEIKIIESSLVGIPCIASNVYAYNKLYTEINKKELLVNDNLYSIVEDISNKKIDINNLRQNVIDKYYIGNVINSIINNYEGILN